MNLTMPWKARADTPVNGVAGKLDEVRRALGHEAEHLAEVAAKYGRDATHQAARVADDVAHQASKIARDTSNASGDTVGSATGVAQSLIKGATELGTALAVTGRKTAADLTQDAKAVADDLKKVRITTEPKKTGPDFMPGITLLGGFGAGIALMYFLDPEQGKRRRAMLRDQLTKWTRITSETVSGRAKDLSNRAAGAAHEARKAVTAGQGTAAEYQSGVGESPAWDPSYGTAGAGTAITGEAPRAGGTEFADSTFSGVGITTPATDTTPAPSGESPWGSSDPSTTDTWGEQPKSEQQSSRIEIS